MASAKKTQDHAEIRRWVESKHGHPATVQGREGLLRIDFNKPDESLERISWDEFFRVFDDRGLTFLYDPDGHMTKFIYADQDDEGDEHDGKSRDSAKRSQASHAA